MPAAQKGVAAAMAPELQRQSGGEKTDVNLTAGCLAEADRQWGCGCVCSQKSFLMSHSLPPSRPLCLPGTAIPLPCAALLL